VRGFTVLNEAAKDDVMQPITVAISNAFVPFGGRGTIQVGGDVARRKVEYTTGLIASAVGHVLADRQATEGCHVIQIPRIGPAERIANDPASGLALLRTYGVADLRPAALDGAEAGGATVTVTGIADPSAQNGGGAITTPSARLSGVAADAERALDPAPPAGFSGAPVSDQRGRLYGVMLRRDEQAVLVPADTVRKVLQARGVTASPAAAAAKDIKAAVVRVICVRS
jgi:hypothetical protein